jgi:hypothetical protein
MKFTLGGGEWCRKLLGMKIGSDLILRQPPPFYVFLSSVLCGEAFVFPILRRSLPVPPHSGQMALAKSAQQAPGRISGLWPHTMPVPLQRGQAFSCHSFILRSPLRSFMPPSDSPKLNPPTIPVSMRPTTHRIQKKHHMFADDCQPVTTGHFSPVNPLEVNPSKCTKI